MTLLQALAHFIAEALSNMRRSWKVNLLAILVTAVSLFLGGALFMLGSNLASALSSWESRGRLVVYMDVGASEEEQQSIARRIGSLPGVAGWALVSPEEAEERLRGRMPELGELIEGLEEAPLPASFEIELERDTRGKAEIDRWVETVRRQPGVAGLDDDRLWIEQIAFVAGLLRLAGVVVGALLISGSVFIIASVIRLAALLHREEIRVLRLVGATEFFVRGPFVVGGVIQGFFGSALALGALAGAFFLLLRREIPELIEALLLSSFLDISELALLLMLGVGAGLLGGLMSVRRTSAGLW